MTDYDLKINVAIDGAASPMMIESAAKAAAVRVKGMYDKVGYYCGDSGFVLFCVGPLPTATIPVPPVPPA